MVLDTYQLFLEFLWNVPQAILLQHCYHGFTLSNFSSMRSADKKTLYVYCFINQSFCFTNSKNHFKKFFKTSTCNIIIITASIVNFVGYYIVLATQVLMLFYYVWIFIPLEGLTLNKELCIKI